MGRKAWEELNLFALLFVPKNINLPRYPFFFLRIDANFKAKSQNASDKLCEKHILRRHLKSPRHALC